MRKRSIPTLLPFSLVMAFLCLGQCPVTAFVPTAPPPAILRHTVPRLVPLTPQLAAAAATTESSSSSLSPIYQISIEYCTGCKWGLRGFWTAQELLSTFRDDRALGAVTVVPSATPGRFAVTAHKADKDVSFAQVLWDRQQHEGFPEMKELKQLVRDEISPDKFLGHSDSTERQEHAPEKDGGAEVLDLSKGAPIAKDTTLSPSHVIPAAPSPHVTITYCTGCQWLLRAAYVAQELVSTFGDDIHAVTLIPSRKPAKGGAFVVTVDGTVVWDRFVQGRFPETKELKQLVRDLVCPDRVLGQHMDDHEKNKEAAAAVEEMDDEEAEEARRFFGVM